MGKKLILGILVIIIMLINGCKPTNKESAVVVIGALRNVMMNGDLGDHIKLDTIADKKNLYGLGPLSHLSGEILINNGVAYISKVATDSTMTVERTFEASAPFFVYTQVSNWSQEILPKKITTIRGLQDWIELKTSNSTVPFALKMTGTVSYAKIHVQNLAKGTKVSSLEEAHQGQRDFYLKDKNVEIIGFFSRNHQGIFTHHDSFLHLHLITENGLQMGHLDEAVFETMKIYLPATLF